MDTSRLLFSIAHNAMTNALRHSNATKVTISLSFDSNDLRLSISDDGGGLPEVRILPIGYTQQDKVENLHV